MEYGVPESGLIGVGRRIFVDRPNKSISIVVPIHDFPGYMSIQCSIHCSQRY